MIQAGAKTLAFKGFKQKKQRKVKHATPQGDYGLYMVKSRSHWSGFSILYHWQPSNLLEQLFRLFRFAAGLRRLRLRKKITDPLTVDPSIVTTSCTSSYSLEITSSLWKYLWSPSQYLSVPSCEASCNDIGRSHWSGSSFLKKPVFEEVQNKIIFVELNMQLFTETMDYMWPSTGFQGMRWTHAHGMLARSNKRTSF